MREKKVYQYNTTKVKRKIISVLRKRKRESTVADLITQTGLPKYQVDETLKIVMDNYYGQMKVTESGQILYYFPGGLRNKKKGFIPGFKRISAKVFRTAGRVLTTLFKIWIMVMLVGYAVIFAALVLFSIAVSIAGSGSSGGRRRGRGGGFGSFYLTARLIDLILYSSVSKKRGSFGNSRQKSRPLHKSIFAFVFGDGDPNKGWELTEKRNAIGFIQKNKGTITIDELMMISGREHSSAHQLINNLLLEYQGSPEVSDKGSLYYKFPELMYTSKSTSNTEYEAESRKLIPFNQNKNKTNKWIAFFNGFNFVFGSYFIYFSAFAGAEAFKSRISLLYQIPRAYFPFSGINPDIFFFIALGVIPIVFSMLFFLIPAVRRFIENRRNERIKRADFMQRIFSWIFRYPEAVEEEDIVPQNNQEKPKNWESIRKKEIERFGAVKGVNIKETADGAIIYAFPELKREKEDIKAVREVTNESEFLTGRTIFDSGK